MPYENTSSRMPSSASLKGVISTAGGLVRIEAHKAGTFPTRETFRGGYNDPRNFFLLSLLRRTKPKRVRFRVKKIVVGYRYIFLKKWYVDRRQKRVRVPTGRVGYYRVRRLVKKGRNKGKLRWFVRSRTIYKFRYITVHRLRFRKVPIRVPIKVRVRVPIIIPPKGEIGDLPPGRRPYLLPNSLLFEDYSRECYPRTNTSRTALLNQNNGSVLFEATREGATTFTFGEYGISYPAPAVGIGPFQQDTGRLPPVDDIYLSATALHGLYAKVASDVPSTLTSLAEAPETVRAVYGILNDGIKLAKALRRLDARSAYRAVNSRVQARRDSLSGLSSKVWLAWYLAASPTISDISEHLSLLSRSDRVWRKFSKSSTEVVRSEQRRPVYDFDVTTQTTTTVKYGVYIAGRMTIDQFKSKVSGSDNLSAALYAVVPFSFIADWAVDVSTYLESAAIFQGLEYDAWKTSSVLYEHSEITNNIGHVPDFGTFTTEKPNRFFIRKFRVDREPLYAGLPEMPLIPWKKRLVNETLINRSLTAAALFRVLGSSKN